MRAHTTLAVAAVRFIRSELGEEGVKAFSARVARAAEQTSNHEFREKTSILGELKLFTEDKIAISPSFWENFKVALDAPAQMALSKPSPFKAAKLSTRMASKASAVAPEAVQSNPTPSTPVTVPAQASQGQIIEEYKPNILGLVPNKINAYEVRERLNFASFDSSTKYGCARIWVAEAARKIATLPFALLRDDGPFFPRNADLHIYETPAHDKLLDEALAFTSFCLEEWEDGIDLQIIVGERALRDHPAQYRSERGHHIYQKLEATDRDMGVWVRLFHKFKVPTPIRPKIKITHQGCPAIFKEYRFLAMGAGILEEVDKAKFDAALVEYNKALEEFEKTGSK